MWTRSTLGLALPFVVLSALARSQEPATNYVITYGSGSGTLKVARTVEGNWTAAEGSKTYGVIFGNDTEIDFVENGQTVARGQLKAGKLKMAGEDGRPYLELKLRHDKIKTTFADEGQPWEIKIRADKIKVVRDDKEFGKVKYYRDTGKLKAKGSDDKVAAEVRQLGRLSAALAPFLVPDLGKGPRNFVTLILLALER